MSCSDAESATEPKGGMKLEFSSCTLLTDPAHAPAGAEFEGIASATAECATTTAPAVWNDPERGSIDLFVKRYPAASQPAKAQIWMLQGGPGFSGMGYEPLVYEMAKSIPDFDFYIPDHRGTGKSSFATEETQNLDGLTATDGAKDVAALIDAARVPSQQVFVFGASYGAYWAQRYLQVRPDQATATILDSAVPAVDYAFAHWDEQFDAAARTVLALCQADATCSAKLGPDPVAKGFEALAAAEAQTCPTFIRRITFGAFLMSGYFRRMLLPASIYRMLRCDAADQTWFERVGQYLTTPGYPDPGHSAVVNKNITYSELWSTDMTADQIRAAENALLAINGSAVWADLEPSWPKYPHDEYYGSWPSTAQPVLVLQGTLDPRTPYGDLLKPHYAAPNQYYVELPLANHGLLARESAPMVDPGADACGWQVMRSFLADPSKPPDTSCITGMAPLDFGKPPAEFLAAVGIQDLWENP